MANPLHYFLVKNLSNGNYSASVARWLTPTIEPSTALQSLPEQNTVGQSHIDSERTYRKHRQHKLFYCCVTSLPTPMLRELYTSPLLLLLAGIT
jgi:hypothetical protein